MAETFLKVLLDNLGSLIQEEIGLIIGVDKEMKKLSSTLTAIQAVLEDAEMKQWESKAINDWLRKLNDLAYEIDDLLDECATQVAKWKLTKSSRYGLKKIRFRNKIGRRMKEASEKLDMIAAERQKFHLREMAIEQQSDFSSIRETSSILNEPERVYGRDEEKEKIVDILVNQVRHSEQLSVLPIIGLGGLGKTTLAQLVFNDTKVVEHFETKIWVCSSDDFDLKRLIKAMIESATGQGSCSDLVFLDALQRRLWELLNQKRYLIVFDDVWNDDPEKWDMLRNAIACGSRGAAVVFTTRLKKVAQLMGTLAIHELKVLSEEDCWLLFKERALGQEKEEHPNLEPIGKKIVKKCCGVPLAAKALGGLLRFKRGRKEWIEVQDSEIWNLQTEENLLLPALRFSYHHLPLRLRQCFAYCSVFPKDTLIDKKELIFCWIAHGYISSRGKLDEEGIGNEIWTELVLRSLFQDVTTSYGETTFRLHDLVHDLARSVMDNKVLGTEEENVKSASKCKIREVKLVRHHVAFPSSHELEIDLSSSFLNLTSLRMLDASRTTTDIVPSTIGNLKHLRYLNLSDTMIHTLPDVICGLWNLKILKLEFCVNLVRLPERMRFLKNLRHLVLEYCYSMSETPPKIGELSSLKTLSLFVVGNGKGNQPGELQFLNLGGKLEICHLERVKDHMDAKMANLHGKADLRELILAWNYRKQSEIRENVDEKVLEALEPHPNLEILQVYGFEGRCFPQWLKNPTLVNLVEFALSSCPNCPSLPQLSELPHLKTMRLSYLDVEYIIEDEVVDGSPSMTKFPTLEELDLDSLLSLKGLAKEEAFEIFPCLQKLGIQKCSSLTLPPLPLLKELTVDDHVSSLKIFISNPENLTSLRFRDGNIPDEALENFTNLQMLTIEKAHENSLSAQGLRGLKSLVSLTLRGSETLTCFPRGWCTHLDALKTLIIEVCSEFDDLPEDISCMKSLTRLILVRLPKMVSLPRSIKEMGNLRYLSIMRCPELERRCDKERGEEWHKISHIHSIRIGNRW